MKKKKPTVLCMILVLLLCMAGCTGEKAAEAGGSGNAPVSPLEGKKVAYIMHMAPSDIFRMWAEGAEETAEALGMEFASFFCNGSDIRWQDTVARCAAGGYDGLLLSHGGQSYAYTFLTDLKKQYPQLKIVTFDTIFQDSQGEIRTIDGVTQFFQQDAKLAQLLLDYICQELYPEKTAAGEPVNILKVWVGPNYLASFDRREEGYAAYEAAGLIRTLETIGPADFTLAKASVAEVAAAALANYAPGEIDAIWCCYDLYARGVFAALTEENYPIPMVSVDICNVDISRMARADSPWKACATTNWTYNGEFGMRVLALELTEEYDRIIDPMTGRASSWLELPVSLVTQDMVSGADIDVTNLDTVAGDSYSDRSWMPTTDWMAELLGD